jgi:hypothetical protein
MLGRVRYANKLFFFSLAWIAGCGGGCDGCGSCSNKSETVEDKSPTTVAVAPREASMPATNDVAPEPTATNAAPVDTGPPYLAASVLPRPSGAPMPMGAMQSCGVYDGPLCEKTCPKGNCRQDCDGIRCVLDCAGGWCSQMCGESGTCTLRCGGGHCIQACANPDACTKDCAGGSCS